MALSVGTPAVVSGSLSSTSVSMSTSGGAGGTGPYTYAWHRSLTTGFSPSASTLIAGAAGLTLADSGLLLGAQYYYVVVVTDTGNANATANSSQSAGQQLTQYPQSSPSQNVFTQSPILGSLDQRVNPQILSMRFDPAGSGTLVAGQAVKWSTVAGGDPMVVPATLAADVIVGFVVYDIKTSTYSPGDQLEVAMNGSVMYLVTPAAVNRGTFVFSAPSATTLGGTGFVRAVTGSSLIAGYALDTSVAGGLCRIMIQTPSSPSIIG